ncbi:MAG: GTP-binding protein [Oscillospiraceae bacterium]|nr:GTP-binding protein [Oscillospiraceae bacterium]
MAKIDIISGFLGAGKTTLIKKLLKEAYAGEKLVLIENEFGEISIDGGFLQDAGVQISEMSSGCICCSLVGDFSAALREVNAQYKPDRILIEPSGVGKLSDVIAAVERVTAEDETLELSSFVTVADASKCKVYMKNFGEFFNDQVESAHCIILSRTGKLSEEKIAAAVALLKEKNPDATVITTPWDALEGRQIRAAMENSSQAEFMHAAMHHHHHHEHECDDPDCCCHDHEHEHHHEHDHDCCCHEHEHEHHHHEHECDDPNCSCHDHEHEHHHHHEHECDDPHCSCHDHHHHHADEVFSSWGRETVKSYGEGDIRRILTALDSGEYGQVVRCKGIVSDGAGKWLHFDYVPEEHDVRFGTPDVTGRLCVIGAQLDEEKLAELFGL